MIFGSLGNLSLGALTPGLIGDVAPAAPINTSAPSITGTPEVGQALTANVGSWTGSPAPTFSYQWMRGASNIAGATGSSYTLVDADDQTNVKVRVTGTNSEGAASADSPLVGVTYALPVASNALPDVTYSQNTGVKTVDASVDFTNATGGAWSLVSPPSGVTIDAAGVVSIQTTGLLAGATVQVRYANSGGSADSAFSATVNAAAGVPNQAATFGALTAANAGGFQPKDSGGAYVPLTAITDQTGAVNTWSVVEGFLICNAPPSGDEALTLTCTYDGGSLEITIAIEASAYSVRTIAQADAAMDAAAPGGGVTVRFRGGPLDLGTADVRLGRNNTYTSQVTVTGEADTVLTPRLQFENCDNFRLTGLDIHDIAGTQSKIINILTGCEGVLIEDCEIHGAFRDPLGDYSDGSYSNSLNGIGWTSGASSGITVRRTKVYDVVTGMNFHIDGDLTLEDLEISKTYSDCIKVRCEGAGLTAPKRIRRVTGHTFIGNPADIGNPHIDFIQFGSSATNNGLDVTNVVIEQIVAWEDPSVSIGRKVQGIASFTDGGDLLIAKDWIIRGCFLMLSGNHNLTLEGLDGGQFYSNTILSMNGEQNALMKLGVTSLGAQPAFKGNLVEQPTTGATDGDSLVIGDGGATLSYASVFAAPTFTPGNLAGLLAAWAMKTDGPADTGASGPSVGDFGAIGTGAATFGAALDPTGWTFNSGYAPGVTQTLALTEMERNGYVFDCNRQTTATVYFRGVGTTGDEIQARGASVGGNTAWGTTTVDVEGNWEVALVVPDTQWGPWYDFEARIGTDDLTKLTGANQFGIGHVLGVFEQSQGEYILSNGSVYTQIAQDVLDAENFSVFTDNGVTGVQSVRVTQAVVDANGVNPGLVALMNAIGLRYSDRKFCILDLAVPGTSRRALMDDADPDRSWTVFDAMVSTARASGSEVGMLLDGWHGDDVATLKTFGLEWAPFYFGQRWGGGAFTVGTANPDSAQNPTSIVDHILFDTETPDNVFGRGYFRQDRTQIVFMGPTAYQDGASDFEQINFTTNSAGTTTGLARPNQLDRPARDALREFAEDTRVQRFSPGYSASMHLVDMDGGVHPARNPGDKHGIPAYALAHLPGVFMGMGDPIKVPSIISQSAASDGSYVDITVDLPNGGTLTTTRTLDLTPAPGTDPAHRQPVTGFEFGRAGDTDRQYRPVFRSAETTYPVDYRGSIVVQDAGTGTAPARTGVIRFTPDTPLVNNDYLEFLRGNATAILFKPRDVTAQLFLDMPLENIADIYDGTKNYRYYGVPVDPQPPVLTVSGVGAGSGLVSPFTINTAWFADSNSVPANTTVLEAEVKFRFPTAPADGTYYLASQTSAIDLYYVYSGGTGSLFVKVEDSAGTTVHGAVVTGVTAPAAGVAQTVLAVVDYAADTVTIFVDGTQQYTAALSPVSDDFSQTVRLLNFGSKSHAARTDGPPLDAQFEFFRWWRTTGGSRVVHKEISVSAQGSIAAINADPWKRGGDVT